MKLPYVYEIVCILILYLCFAFTYLFYREIVAAVDTFIILVVIFSILGVYLFLIIQMKIKVLPPKRHCLTVMGTCVPGGVLWFTVEHL